VRELNALVLAAAAVHAHATATHVAAMQQAVAGSSLRAFGVDTGSEVGRPVPVAGRVSRRRSSDARDRSPQRGVLLVAAGLAVLGGVAAAALFGGRPVAPSPPPSSTALAVVPSASASGSLIPSTSPSSTP